MIVYRMHNAVNHHGMVCSDLEKHFLLQFMSFDRKQHLIVITNIDGERDVLLIMCLVTSIAVRSVSVLNAKCCEPSWYGKQWLPKEFVSQLTIPERKQHVIMM